MEQILNFLLPLLLSFCNFAIDSLPPLEQLSTKEFVDIRMIENITNPQQVLWQDEGNIVFVVDENIWEFIISEGSTTQIGTRKPNEFVGLNEDGSLLFCEIEHYIITSPDQFSTKFTIREKSREGDMEDEKKEEKRELYFFKTIRPIYLDSDRIIAVTAVDFLKTYHYVVNTETGEKEEIKKQEALQKVGDVKDINLNIPKDFEVKKTYIKNEDRYIVEDVFGNIYLYVRRNLREKIVDYINQSLGTYAKK